MNRTCQEFPGSRSGSSALELPAVTSSRNGVRMPQVQSESSDSALDTWFVTVYEQLRSLARQRLSSERSDHTLQPTALVNEVFLRLQKDGSLDPSDTSRFFLAAAEAMRRILIE